MRPSILPIAEICGHAAKLAEENPQGSSWANYGTGGHGEMQQGVEGKLPDNHRFQAVLACLPKGKWEAEVQIALKDPLTGSWILGGPDKDGKRTGRTDFVCTHPDGGLTVGDWKFGDPVKVMPPDDNLQLLAYGVALAIERKAPWFKLFIWTERNGFDWGKRKFTDADYMGIVERIQDVAKMRRDVPVVGPHCGDMCYSRSYCKAWQLPVVTDGHQALEPFTRPAGLNANNVVNALCVVKAMEDATKIAKGRLEAYVDANGPIVDGKKEWGPAQFRGRRSANLVAIEKAGLLPQVEAAGGITESAPYTSYRWTNKR